MKSIGPQRDGKFDRRTLVKGGIAAGGLLAGAGLGIARLADASEDSGQTPAAKRKQPFSVDPEHPNILVILVDQMRFPTWFSPTGDGSGLPPNLAALRQESVSFSGHYTAANDCTPARSTMLTGLYSHQTGCLITGGSTLDPGFPTWGTMLREQGYRTRWYGKWHLTHHDGKWTRRRGERAMQGYGFHGGTYPSPNGAPGQGWRVDGHIARQFGKWFAEEGGSGPWCTTVSFVNPHDIAWWYLWSNRVRAETSARPVTQALPGNFETPELLIQRNKPALQRSLQSTAAASFGPVPYEGPEAAQLWMQFLDLYGKLQREVDMHIGQVLAALNSRPQVAANTVIVFTSDHGEYGGSHGLRGKGAGAYEEALRVPLMVKDNRGVLTQSVDTTRSQLTSSVDVAPLLLTIATGSNAWRSEAHYEHLAGRADLASILADANAPGRPYVMHATDETVTEFAIESYAADAPLHVAALRTQEAKYATYSTWSPGGIEPIAASLERELYDYSTDSGRLELHNSAGDSALEEGLRTTHEQAFEQELRGPLPARLNAAHSRGFADYFDVAKKAANNAATAREKRAERYFEGLQEQGGVPAGETRVKQLRRASRATRR
ncbi:MAG TPA: sulfatase-like hydrolase/transferase [Burkholderiaceae bacterium]|jgi:arylsulfatase A-like enzyme|nr:sulfatase-like hydrolase/transferase [Burkholderiaceae bacterium]